MTIRLGVNVDHVATLRNARGGDYPCPVRAALLAANAGADGITAHLREDRRHIRDEDIFRLKDEVPIPLNFEMAATQEMLQIALKVRPHAVCLVPEKREERTTEGGLDIITNRGTLEQIIPRLKGAGIRVSLFIDPLKAQIEAAHALGADIVELHTGTYCEASGLERMQALQFIRAAAAYTKEEGIECHAGHGLTFVTVSAIAAIPEVRELNIGHFLIGEAVFEGLPFVIAEMKRLMKEAHA